MAKKTAVIDIGSNSISLVIYEKSSRYAFHLIEKLRSRVRIGEGAYDNGGILTQEAMQKAYDTLDEFLSVIKSLGCRKTLTVATSALRDAPNKKEFLKKVKDGLKLNIKIIDGQKEAYFGAVAALNLLPKLNDATTIDIGGGSTELAKIENGKIVDTISLNLGTVRLKELFFDKSLDYSLSKEYIDDILDNLPDRFKSDTIVGIGGTIRALSASILKDTKYPIDALHAFSYNYQKHQKFIESIAKSEVLKLKDTSISKNRYDTIREGSAIFLSLCKRLEAKDIVTSKAGVREGVYLTDLLRSSNHVFPNNFNVSVKNLIDRFSLYDKHIPQMRKTALEIYSKTYHEFDRDKKYEKTLEMASKLLLITRRLNIYSDSDISFDFLVENLNFSLSHKEKILIAFILRYAHKKGVDEKEIKQFKALLPNTKTIEWLSFILSLTVCTNKSKRAQKIVVTYDKKVLSIFSDKKLFIAKECIKRLKKPASFAVKIEKD